MLGEISIKDFAIIDELRLAFTPGLNILTGETGAGKSILVDALGAVLGDRVHAEQVRTGAEESVLAAVFDGCDGPWGDMLREKGLSPDEEGKVYIRRRIARGGRAQAWINGAPVPAGLLAEVGSRLVDIHGQHQHQTLLKVSSHLEILDDYGALAGAREEFAAAFRRWAELTRKLERADEEARQRESQREFLAFQLREIDAAGLTAGEEEELERDRALMQNAEKVSLLAGQAIELLHEGEGAAAGEVEAAAARLDELARFLPVAAAVAADLKGAASALKEAAGQVQSWLEGAAYDPERHNQVEERLAVIARLKRKHGASVAEILANRDDLAAKLAAVEGAGGRAEEWTREKERLLEEMAALGSSLTAGREKTARRIEKEVGANLAELGLAKARLTVAFTPRLDEAGPVTAGGRRYRPWEGGLEEAEFLFSANPGEEPKGLARVASGGEISRVMLALKASLAKVDRVMTLIFDEIDTGIGGAVARTVGRKLKKLSGERQVICVTHLPQIAGLADTHFQVQKEASGGSARVSAVRLERGERIEELARMVAGDAVTPAAVRHARELMEGR